MGPVVMFVLYAFFLALHAWCFKTPEHSWAEALRCWPGLYVVWLLLALGIAERAHRWRWLSNLMRWR